jgi:hypothetical protein
MYPATPPPPLFVAGLALPPYHLVKVAQQLAGPPSPGEVAKTAKRLLLCVFMHLRAYLYIFSEIRTSVRSCIEAPHRLSLCSKH